MAKIEGAIQQEIHTHQQHCPQYIEREQTKQINTPQHIIQKEEQYGTHQQSGLTQELAVPVSYKIPNMLLIVKAGKCIVGHRR